jgi:hypothetical protein
MPSSNVRDAISPSIFRFLTVCLIAAFVLCGIWGRGKAHCFTTMGTGVLASTDRVFSDALGVDGAAEQIVDAISRLPPSQPLALVVPDTTVLGPIMQQMISSIAWPHKVCLISVKNGDVRKAFRESPDSNFAAYFFFGLTPPVLNSNARHVGALTIIQAAG